MGKSFKNLISKYGGWLVRILGFIADAYTVITIKWSSSPASISFVTNPYWLLTLWFITLFSYLAFIEWIGKKENPEIHFKRFIFEVFQFNHPILLAPIPFFVFCFFAIFIKTGNPDTGSLFIMSISLLTLVLFINNIVKYNKLTNEDYIIKSKWNEIDKFIGGKIKGNYYIDSTDIYTLCQIYNINKESLEIILFTYYLKHSVKTKYGNLFFFTEEGKTIYIYNCLINLNLFPNDEYIIE